MCGRAVREKTKVRTKVKDKIANCANHVIYLVTDLNKDNNSTSEFHFKINYECNTVEDEIEETSSRVLHITW